MSKISLEKRAGIIVDTSYLIRLNNMENGFQYLADELEKLECGSTVALDRSAPGPIQDYNDYRAIIGAFARKNRLCILLTHESDVEMIRPYTGQGYTLLKERGKYLLVPGEQHASKKKYGARTS